MSAYFFEESSGQAWLPRQGRRSHNSGTETLIGFSLFNQYFTVIAVCRCPS